MTTADRPSLRTPETTRSPAGYDAFLSYSHAA
jgi:hypothetical protein